MAPCLHHPQTLEASANEDKTQELPPREYKIIPMNVLRFGYWHIAGLYGLYQCFTVAKWQTIALAYVTFALACLGITAGVHRLWSHRAYKARPPLQALLMVMNTLAFQNTVISWVRDHRLHHMCSDTDADPHNAKRGFFFSHIGWLLVRKHDDVIRRGRTIDISDILANPVLRFQKKYAIPFIGTICFGLPTLIPVYLWGESLWASWNITLFRYMMNLHVTFLVNSAAHMWGNRPYDRGINPVQNIPISVACFGEGFHNYHHVFPWDYRAAELGNNWLNPTTLFIDFFAWVGWAYDLKTAPDDMVRSRMARNGDGSDLWGWSERDIMGDETVEGKAGEKSD